MQKTISHTTKAILLSSITIGLMMLWTTTASAASANTWNGAGDGTSWSDSSNWSAGAITPAGQNLIFNNNGLVATRTTTNDLSPLATVNQLVIGGNDAINTEINGSKLFVKDRIKGVTNGSTLNLIDNKIVADGDISVVARNNTTLFLSGVMNTNNNSVTFSTADNGLVILGNGVNVYGSGDLKIKGDGIGVNLLTSGSEISVKTTIVSGGILTGKGQLARTNVYTGGTLEPYGCLDTGSLLVRDGTLKITIGGNSGCDIDKADVNGKVDLRRGRLTLLVNGYVPQIDEWFTIIRNDKDDEVIGNFRGLAQGDKFIVGGYQFKISYVAGTGNDVAVKLVTYVGGK